MRPKIYRRASSISTMKLAIAKEVPLRLLQCLEIGASQTKTDANVFIAEYWLGNEAPRKVSSGEWSNPWPGRCVRVRDSLWSKNFVTPSLRNRRALLRTYVGSFLIPVDQSRAHEYRTNFAVILSGNHSRSIQDDSFLPQEK